MIIGVPKESFPGERRVAMVPSVVPSLTKAGFEVAVEAGAGVSAGYLDKDYTDKGARIVGSRAEVFKTADVVVQVLCYGSNDRTGKDDLPLYRQGQFLVGFLRPLGTVETLKDIASKGVSSFSIELMPRITRAQSMDALSAMATVAGYKAVLLAADTLPRLCPMLTTAAGTVTPARMLIIGAGVAGLQAIATARRLGAVASAYDVRPAVKEQVQSLGGRFVELPLEAKDAQDARGYATAQDETFYRRQRELLGRVVAESDVVITTAVVPGQEGPGPGDGGDGEGHGAGIGDRRSGRRARRQLRADRSRQRPSSSTTSASWAPSTWPAHVPYHASQMYAKNVATFLLHLFKGGKPELNLEDEITRETLITRGGEIVHGRVREFFSLPPK